MAVLPVTSIFLHHKIIYKYKLCVFGCFPGRHIIMCWSGWCAAAAELDRNPQKCWGQLEMCSISMSAVILIGQEYPGSDVISTPSLVLLSNSQLYKLCRTSGDTWQKVTHTLNKMTEIGTWMMVNSHRDLIVHSILHS